jgi:predicted short-subunit dehydrogenase-like oxidoreductase (DUF2520 family)
MPQNELQAHLAVALLRRAEAVLRLPYNPPDVAQRPLFVGRGSFLGAHAIDSLDLIELIVAIEEDVGALMLDRVELTRARSLAGIAELVLERADRQAVERFCAAWAAVGVYHI